MRFHDLSAPGEHRADLMAVDLLGYFGAAGMADQPDDVLDGYA
jgi:hypothetical protein